MIGQNKIPRRLWPPPLVSSLYGNSGNCPVVAITRASVVWFNPGRLTETSPPKPCRDGINWPAVSSPSVAGTIFSCYKFNQRSAWYKKDYRKVLNGIPSSHSSWHCSRPIHDHPSTYHTYPSPHLSHIGGPYNLQRYSINARKRCIPPHSLALLDLPRSLPRE